MTEKVTPIGNPEGVPKSVLRKRRMRERRRQGIPAAPPFEPRTALGRTIREHSLTGLDELTVLQHQHDPFRLDTASNHRDGAWVGAQMARLVPHGEVHLRGLHYRLVAAADVEKPNGQIYRNTEDDWTWLIERAAKAARWLGYVSFDRIIDERNQPPMISEPQVVTAAPRTTLSATHEIELPEDAGDLFPQVDCSMLSAKQPYRIIFCGEKSSLGQVLRPLAGQVHGELVLPNGEMTDTLVYGIAERAAADSRPAVILYFSDFDPSGWGMPMVIARKMQALGVEHFPDLDIEVHHVALTLDQVIEYDLPSTPLKETELRGDHWREVMGREQTEIDALAALRPEVLQQIARDAVAPFFDFTLRGRAEMAWVRWHRQAVAQLHAHPEYDAACEAITAALDDVEAAVEELDRVQDEAVEKLRDDVRLPKAEMVEPEITDEAPVPLYTSAEDFITATGRLIDHKKLNGKQAEAAE